MTSAKIFYDSSFHLSISRFLWLLWGLCPYLMSLWSFSTLLQPMWLLCDDWRRTSLRRGTLQRRQGVLIGRSSMVLNWSPLTGSIWKPPSSQLCLPDVHLVWSTPFILRSLVTYSSLIPTACLSQCWAIQFFLSASFGFDLGLVLIANFEKSKLWLMQI